MRARVTVHVTVRFFAAARAAAGVEHTTVDLPAGATTAGLVRILETRGEALAGVLGRCSYLCDGVAVRDPHTPLEDGQTIDVLPPFAGG